MKSSLWKSALASSAGRALLALLLVIIAGAIFNADGAFFKIGTHRDTLRQASVYGILACGMTLVIISGGIDLSVGSVLGLCAVLFARQTLHEGQDPWVALALVLGAGAAIGLVSGTLVARFRIQPFV